MLQKKKNKEPGFSSKTVNPKQLQLCRSMVNSVLPACYENKWESINISFLILRWHYSRRLNATFITKLRQT